MPFIFKHRRPPQPWHEMRKKTAHRVLVPLYYANWLGEWVVYLLSRWSVFEILEYFGSLSILVAVIFYFADKGDRLKQKHYQAWQVINTAQGKGGSGGRIEALQELNEDRVPLVGVNASEAYLQDVKLLEADLRRCDLHAADLRHADLAGSNLEGSNLRSANLRDARLEGCRLTDASLADADLTGANMTGASVLGVDFSLADLRNANLSGLREWREIKSIRSANIHGVRGAPEGFAAWAMMQGAVDSPKEGDWNESQSATAHPAATRPH